MCVLGCVRVGWGDNGTAFALPYFPFSINNKCSGEEGEDLISGPFHATVIPSNLIQLSSFALVCSSHVGACRLQKPCLYVCARVCVREETEGEEKGRQTELISSDCVFKYKCLFCGCRPEPGVGWR